MAALETPWFMKTKTSDLRKVNQVFEERFQKQVSIIESKQRKSIMKINEEIKDLRKDFQRIRTEVDFSTDLDKRGRQTNLNVIRSKSSGDLTPGVPVEKPMPKTRSAMLRHRKFVQAVNMRKRRPPPITVTEMLKEKYAEGYELRRLQAQLQQTISHHPLEHQTHRKRKPKKNTTRKCMALSTKAGSERPDVERLELGDDRECGNHVNKSDDHLPTIIDSARERRFSIASPRKRSHGLLPSINGVDTKHSKPGRRKSYDDI